MDLASPVNRRKRVVLKEIRCRVDVRRNHVIVNPNAVNLHRQQNLDAKFLEIPRRRDSRTTSPALTEKNDPRTCLFLWIELAVAIGIEGVSNQPEGKSAAMV